MKTRATKQKEIEEKWYLIDAKGKRIGRIATKAAHLLMGKNNPLVKSYIDPKAKVVVINADKIDFTEKRGFSKFYMNYSGFPSGLKVTSLEDVMKKAPTKPLEHAIRGMLPRNKRGDALYTNLYVYASETHPHNGQQPVAVETN